MPGVPVSFSQTPGEVGRPGPVLGEDGADVLGDFWFSAKEIAQLQDSGAMKGPRA